MLNGLLLVPLIGAAIISFWPSTLSPKLARQLALVVAIISLVWSLVLLTEFNPQDPNLQFVVLFPWIDSLGLSYSLGMDGLSLPLVVLNSLLTAIAIYATDKSIKRPRFYYSLILLLAVSVFGAFLAQDLLLFFLFYELELIPLYLLIAIWGGPRRGYASTKFLIYTAISGILILAGFLGVVWLSGSSNFAYDQAVAHTLPLGTQLLLLGTIVIGFGIKIPLVPFHTWLPDAHVEASTPISVLLAGVLLKLGTYGLLRFGLNMFSEAWVYISPWLAIWAVVSVLYGSFNAIAQKDMKKMVAYSSVGHMGYILLASAAATPLSILGTVFQMVSHGLISALLFLLVGVVYKKAGTRDIDILRGLLNPEQGLPLIGSLMILGVMASAGIPGMVGFISEFLVFRGSFNVFTVPTLLCMIGTGLTSAYFLLLANRVFFGRLSETVVNLPPVEWSDRIPAIILMILIVILGIQPNWMLRWTETEANTMSVSQPMLSQVVKKSAIAPLPVLINYSE
ncbi:NADH-quinone oxidoreductase subunit M [Okeania sp. SIO2B3]|uniref:NADH-quinone oxidoreductase subunit M n=1 Tax=Okeania sp. SIO2B3 TaxID=2607784 RepID=UPI0013C1AF2C|nr:NADH-quinone oxidoreductase subunit M [Okeania sp. SIO2B3]NET41510.1 NADH-quinone oxidoreductase subunit M [Okeania sp. SIO2B3]